MGGWEGCSEKKGEARKAPEMRGGLAGWGLSGTGARVQLGRGQGCLPPGLVYPLSLVRAPCIFFPGGSVRIEKDIQVFIIGVRFQNPRQLGCPVLPMRKWRPQA